MDGEVTPMQSSDADRALRTLLPATSKFTQNLHNAIRQKESGWYRLNVKVDRGRVKTVQLATDEQIDVPNLDSETEGQ